MFANYFLTILAPWMRDILNTHVLHWGFRCFWRLLPLQHWCMLWSRQYLKKLQVRWWGVFMKRQKSGYSRSAGLRSFLTEGFHTRAQAHNRHKRGHCFDHVCGCSQVANCEWLCLLNLVFRTMFKIQCNGWLCRRSINLQNELFLFGKRPCM